MFLALCAGNSPVTGEFPAQWPVTRSFDVFFDLRLNKRLSKQKREAGDLRRHRAYYDVIVMVLFQVSHGDWLNSYWQLGTCKGNSRYLISQRAKFMWPTWGPPRADRAPRWPHEPWYQGCSFCYTGDHISSDVDVVLYIVSRNILYSVPILASDWLTTVEKRQCIPRLTLSAWCIFCLTLMVTSQWRLRPRVAYCTWPSEIVMFINETLYLIFRVLTMINRLYYGELFIGWLAF